MGWNHEYDLAKDAESDTVSDSTGGDGASFPVHWAVMEGLESDVELESDGDEFDRITSDGDVAIERARVLPEYVLQDQDDYNIAQGGLHEEREESDPSGLRAERDDDDWPCRLTFTLTSDLLLLCSSAPPYHDKHILYY